MTTTILIAGITWGLAVGPAWIVACEIVRRRENLTMPTGTVHWITEGRTTRPTREEPTCPTPSPTPRR